MMEANRKISFFIISKLFKDHENGLERSENAYNSGHIKKMNFLGNVVPAMIRGEVHASMKKKYYDVEISIDLDKKEVVSKYCTCPRGLDLCHHMATLLYYAHYNISSTNTERSWGVIRAEAAPENIQTVEQLFGHSQSYRAIRNPEMLDKERFRGMLGDTNVVGFSWLLRPEADVSTANLIVSIEDIVLSQEFLESENKMTYFVDKCSISEDTVLEIANATVGQNRNDAWLIIRKNRLTASKFGLVIQASKRDKFPPSLYKSLMESYDIDRALAVQWGITHEKTAIEKFSKLVGLSVKTTGLWLDSCGYFGGSPDGLIGDDTLLEVKCLYSMRNCSIKEYVLTKKYFFKYENNNIVIDVNHLYYHQVQGQLYVTKRKECYFVIWTPNEIEFFIIQKDEEWSSNMEMLKNFYVTKYLANVFSVNL